MDYTSIAKTYIENDFSVISLQIDGSKDPVGSWRPYQERFASDHELSQWFGTEKPCGIGVVAGSISGNLLVIDFDFESEIHLKRFLDEAERHRSGISSDLVIVATPRPGRQVWLRQSSKPAGNQVLARTEPMPTNEVDADGDLICRPKVLIETRGTGGYAVAVGSPPAVHTTGRPYELISGKFDELPQLSDADVEALLAICRGFNQFEAHVGQDVVAEAYHGEPRPGDVYNQHADIRELLVKYGWSFHHTCHDGVEYWTRPGKETTDGYSATLGHILSEDGSPLFYVFSSSVSPLEPNRCYNAFALYVHYEHGGDYSAAAAGARALYEPELRIAQVDYHRDGEAPILPDSFLDYQPFPVECLPQPLGRYVVAASHSIGCDPAMVGVQILPAMAGLIGQARRIHLRDDWTQPAILWTAVICPVGDCKSPTYDAARIALAAVNSRLVSNNQLLKAEYERELAAHKSDRSNPQPSKPTPSQVMVSNVTIEALLRRLESNWKGLVYGKDELAGWIKSFNAYRSGNGADQETWLSLWDGRIETVDRVLNDLHIDEGTCALSAMGTIQPAVATRVLLANDTTENGMAARLLVCQPSNPFLVDDGQSRIDQSDGVKQEVIELGRRMYSLTGRQDVSGEIAPIYISLAPEAVAPFFNFKNETKRVVWELPEGPLKSAVAKLDSQTARIALLFSVTRQLTENPHSTAESPVTREDMEAAVVLARWFWREAQRFYGQLSETDEQKIQKKVLEWMRRRGDTGVTSRQVQQGIRELRTAAETKAHLENMVADGLLRASVSSAGNNEVYFSGDNMLTTPNLLAS